MVYYWWLQDDITIADIGEETNHSLPIQSYECKLRKEEHDAKDQLQEPDVFRSCSLEKEKVAEGMLLSFFRFMFNGFMHGRFCFVMSWCFAYYCEEK